MSQLVTNCRSAQISIDLAAIKNNFKLVQQLTPHSKIMPVIKSNAYGHGMLQVANALTDADGFAVAQLEEALVLREHGVKLPITVFQGFINESQLDLMIKNNLRPAISQPWQIELLKVYDNQSNSVENVLGVWLKINTGMGRLGVQPDEVSKCLNQLEQISCIKEAGLMMHFANADQPDHASNIQQLNCFNSISENIGTQTSVSNSAAIIGKLCVQQDWVRPGIMLYGSSPFNDQTAIDLGLQAVMTLTAKLIAINHLPKGHHVGYGDTWMCPEDMPVGIVNVGYGDGYPRHAPTGTPVMINNQLTQLVGRVSMDSIAIDLRGIEASCGNDVELWGKNVSVDEVASKSGTISYELLCNVGRE